MGIANIIKKPMAQNFVALVLLQGVNYLLPLISFPFLFRVLGVERWGLVSFGYATIQYLILLTDFGFNLSATKYISMNKDNAEAVNRYTNAAFVCRILLGVVSLLIIFFLITVVGKFKIEAKFFLLYFGMVIGHIMFPMWYFQGMEKMKYITLFNIAAKAITFLPFFIFIKEPKDYILVPLFYSIGYIFAGLISLYLVFFKEKLKWFIPPLEDIKFAFKESATYFLSRISVYLYTSSNTFIIGLIFGNTSAGLYSAAEKLYLAYNQLLTPFTGVLFPHMASKRDVPFFKRILKIVVPSNVVIIIGILLTSSWVLHIIYGADVQIETLELFRIMMLSCLFAIPSILMGYPFLAALGHASYTNWTVVLVSIIHISGLLLLFVLGLLSIYTVAIMVVLAEFLLFVFRLRGVRRYKLFAQ